MGCMKTTSNHAIQSPYVVETAGLTKRFGERTVVRGVDLRVPRGSAFGYLGPNGAGKTTLIRMLLGLTPATAGSMKLLGHPVPAGIQECRSFVRRFVDEGRTIVLSSHLLDEIEKTCDHVAIVDGGTIVAQGSIADLRGDGHVVFVGVDDTDRARRLLAASPAVERVVDDGETLAVTVLDARVVPDLNRRLVEAGIAV